MSANLAQHSSDWEWTLCPVCGDRVSRHHRTLESICPEVLFHKPVQPIHLVECNSCGLIYTNPRPVQEVHKRLFTKEAFFGASFQDYLAKELVIRSSARMRLASVSQLMQPGRLLDVGCCLGFFLEEARRQGWTVRGAEISKEFVDYACQTFRLDVVNLAAEDLDLPAGSADLVTLWGVIGYVRSPRSLFDSIWRILSPGGTVFFSVANIHSLDYWLLGDRWPWLYPGASLVYFSKRPLTYMLSRAGFRVLRLWSEAGPDDLFAAAAKRMWRSSVSSQAKQHDKVETPTGFREWIKQSLKLSYRVLSPLVCKVGAGGNLIVIAQKQ